MHSPEGGPRPEVTEQQPQPKTEEQIIQYIHDFIEDKKGEYSYEAIYRGLYNEGYPRNMIVDSNIHYYLDENHEEFDYQLLYQELYKAKYTRDEIVDANITHYLKENTGKFSLEELEKALLEVDPPYTAEEIERNKTATVYKPTAETETPATETAPAPAEVIDEPEEMGGDKPQRAAIAPEVLSLDENFEKSSFAELERMRDLLQAEIDDADVLGGLIYPEERSKQKSAEEMLNKIILEIDRRQEKEEQKKKYPANFQFKSFNLDVPLEDRSVEYIETTLLPLLESRLIIAKAPATKGKRNRRGGKVGEIKGDIAVLKTYIKARKIFEANL